MELHGLPENFWVVIKPSPFSGMSDVCFACTFARLMLQTRGGLQEADIIGIFADETEAKEAAKGLLGMNIVPPGG